MAVESAKRNMASLGSTIASMASPLGLISTLSVGTFAAMAKAGIDTAARLDDLSESTGASVEVLSKLGHVAGVSGVSLETVEGGLIRLSRALHESNDESKGAARALSAIGIQAEMLRNLDTGQAMTEVAKALAEYRDSAGKTAVALDIFGKSGAQLLPYLKDLAEAGELNATVTAAQAAEAERLQKHVGLLSTSWNEMARSLTLSVVPALNETIDSFKKAREAGMGSLQALTGFGVRGLNESVSDAKANAGQHLVDLNQELLKLQRDQAYYRERGDSLMARDVQVDMASVEAKIKYYKALQADSALENHAASYSNEGGAGGARSLADYVSTAGKDPKGSGTRGKSALDRMRGLGQKNELEAYYATGGEETMREVADKRAMESAREYARGLDKIAASEQKLIGMTAAGKLEDINEQLDVAARLLAEDKISFEGYDQIVAQLGGLKKEGKNTFDELGQLIDGWGKQSASAIADFVVDGKGDFADLAKAFIKEWTAMVMYQNVTKPLAESSKNWVGTLVGLVGSYFTGTSTSTGGAGSMSSGGSVQGNSSYIYDLHSGGVVGSGEGSGLHARPMSLFDDAARYHGGGLVDGEVPIIAKKGEGVFTPEQMKAMGGDSIQINVAVDASGERAEGGNAQSAELGRKIGAAVRAVILEEKRSGGMLAG
ncbi:MAG: phage tail tape measure protein [Rhodocyclales bacterium]|nr:phage tail tape measure protein [Rhodocyclales bacterium]